MNNSITVPRVMLARRRALVNLAPPFDGLILS
jgi:hypothetical protein